MPKKKPAGPTPPPIVPLTSRPGFLIRRLNQIHYAIFFEECRDFNITPVQYGMLTALSVAPGLDQKALGLAVGLDRTNTADVLKRLEERGLVTRHQSESDGRVKHAFITDDGLNFTNAMYDAMISAQQRLLAPLSEEDRAKFLDMLHVLVDSNNEFGRASMKAL
ncbi:MAG: MarR family transcriptional regulator [Noviherbaspirillum sp.]